MTFLLFNFERRITFKVSYSFEILAVHALENPSKTSQAMHAAMFDAYSLHLAGCLNKCTISNNALAEERQK